MYRNTEELERPGLDGLSDSEFAKKYAIVKANYAELYNLPAWVVQYVQRLGQAVSELERELKRETVKETREALSPYIQRAKHDILKTNDDIANAWKARELLEKWGTEWASVKARGGPSKRKLVQSGEAALNWMVNYGMAIHQEYKTKRNWSVERIKRFIKAGKSTGPTTFKGMIIGELTPILYGVGALVALFVFLKVKNL